MVLLKDQGLQKDYNKKCQSITIATPSKICAMFTENDHLPECHIKIEQEEQRVGKKNIGVCNILTTLHAYKHLSTWDA